MKLTISESDLHIGGRSRSMGWKLLLVCGLALVMTIPALFVDSLVEERTHRAAEVVGDISAHVGGQQTFLGPTLAIPFRYLAKDGSPIMGPTGIYIVFPSHASGVLKTTTEERHRSLFKVPVYQADLNLDSQFDLTGVPSGLPSNTQLDWSRAEIIVGVKDARGALNDATVSMGETNATLLPAQIAADFRLGTNESGLKLTLLGAPAGNLAKPGARFNASSVLRFSGAQRLAVLAYGKTTRIEMQGDWASPGFDGSFLPTRRSLSAAGFRADWTVPLIARGVRGEGPYETLNGLDATAFGVSFIETADAYQSVNRSLKYALLFVGLVFLSFFTFEVTTGKRVHPAQYALVGLAQMIFYLLLLSLAERIGFDIAFLLAGTATVLLLAINARWVFASIRQGVRALVMFSLLYGMIYLLLRLEDNALLIGSVACFATVAALMYLTRGIDWYGWSSHGSAPEEPSNPSLPVG